MPLDRLLLTASIWCFLVFDKTMAIRVVSMLSTLKTRFFEEEAKVMNTIKMGTAWWVFDYILFFTSFYLKLLSYPRVAHDLTTIYRNWPMALFWFMSIRKISYCLYTTVSCCRAFLKVGNFLVRFFLTIMEV